MADFKFSCPHCKQSLEAEDDMRGQAVSCPACNGQIQVPSLAPARQATPRPLSMRAATTQQPATEMMFCPKCGERNRENNFKCTRCGVVLHGPTQPQHVVSDDSTMGGLIPYKNAQALWAYYLGIFSLIPCVGIPLGIAALILGIRGLKYGDLHPEARGKGHAWTGIILGGLCAVGYTLLIAIPMLMGAFN